MKTIILLFVIVAALTAYVLVSVVMNIPRSGNPGISNNIEDAKNNGVFVEVPRSNLNEILSERFNVRPLEVWIECAWVHTGVFPWDVNYVCKDGFRVCARFSCQDFDILTASGFPMDWEILSRFNEKVIDVRLSPPDLIMFYYDELPQAPIAFELSYPNE